MYWDTVGNVRPKDVYRCKDCGQLTIICQDGRKYWTHPAKWNRNSGSYRI